MQSAKIIRGGQSLFDLATQYCGGPEKAVQIMIDNGITDFCATFNPGDELLIDQSSDAISAYLAKKGVTVATQPAKLTGIDYMEIENDFIID
jgi:hypothetical protein